MTRPGRLFGTVGSRRLAGAPDFLAGALSEAATTQLASRPDVLARFVAGRDRTLATMAETRAFIDAHAAAWPDNHVIGKAAYEQMLREEQLLPFDAADIERMARDELAHGWAEEAWLRSVSAQRKIPFGAASGGGMAPSGPALVGYYRDRIAELHAFVRDHDVVTVPDWLGAMEIVETPAFLQPVSPGASMRSPRRFAKATTGYYFITPPTSLAEAAERLDMNQDFDRDRIWSTAAHEAMPGHFLQLSIARRHPELRAPHPRRQLPRRRLGVLRRGDVRPPRPLRRRPRRAPLHGALGARARRARDRRPEARLGRVDDRAGGRLLRRPVGLHARRRRRRRSTASRSARATSSRTPSAGSSCRRCSPSTCVRTGERGSLRDFHDRLLSYGPVPFAVLGPELLADLDKPASAVRAAANY